MAAVTLTNPSDFADRTQTFFNPKLLKALEYNLKLAQYGLSEGYKAIGNTIRFFRPRKANTAGINAQSGRTPAGITLISTPTALTEGVAPTGLTEVAVGYKDITLYQQGGLATITDRVQAIDLLNTLQVYSGTMGKDAALDFDSVIRNGLIAGLANSNSTYASISDGGYFERFAGVLNSGTSAADYGSLAASSQANGKITRAEVLKVVTQLASSKIPKINGNYVAVTPPQVTHDIRQDETWVRAAVFAGDPLYKDLDLMLDGVAFVRATNPWVEGGAYLTESVTNPGNGLIYSTIFLGADAFGIPNLSNKRAGGSGASPKIVILDSADKADPLNQKTYIGWKALYGSAPFITSVSGELPRYVVLRSKSTFA